MRYLSGDCELDSERASLLRAGHIVLLRPKAFELLTYLLDHPARLIAKQELCEQVWQGHFISDSTLESTMRAVRRAIGDSGRAQQMIETRYRQGYRFVGEVSRVSAVAIEAPPPEPSATSPPPVAERKVVTLLSCLLPPAPSDSLDTLHERYHAFYEQIEQTAAPYGGTLQALADDRLLLVFGAPLSHEDHAQRGALTALALQQQLNGNGHATLRLALHTAEVAVGGGSHGAAPLVMGDGVGTVLALAAAAVPGSIVCSAATAERLQGVFQLQALEPLATDGQPPLSVYRVQSSPAFPADSEQRFANRFIGRRQELATLQSLTARAMQGEAQVVGVVGEAGMGKTRLLYEYRRRVQGVRLFYVQGHCLSYGQNSPYLPLLSVLRRQWGIGVGETAERITATVEQRLSALDLPPVELAPYLLRLLDVPTETDLLDTVSPQAIRSRTTEALVQIVLHRARAKPLVLEVENLHWVDPSTQEVLEALVNRLPGAAILLLTTYRPGYRPPWVEKSYVSQVSLSGLSPEESRQLVQDAMGAREIPEDVMQAAVARGHGNPLFLEELAHTLAEPSTDLQDASVPETVQVVVASRLDRLPAESKRLLQVASVIGNEVPLELLQAVSEQGEAGLNHLLSQLQSEEFLIARNRQSESVYRFRHILVQEAVYQSLLRSSRQGLHRQIAEAMVAQGGEIPPEVIAHHYTEAGDNAEAIAYWQRAGEEALGRTALREAIGHLRRGLDLIATLPESAERAQMELGLLMQLGPALMATQGYGSAEMEQIYSRAQSLCDALGEVPQLFPVRYGLWVYRLVRCEFQAARTQAEVMLRLAEQQNDQERILISCHTLGSTLTLMDAVPQAKIYLERAIALYDVNQHQRQVRLTGMTLGWPIWPSCHFSCGFKAIRNRHG